MSGGFVASGFVVSGLGGGTEEVRIEHWWWGPPSNTHNAPLPAELFVRSRSASAKLSLSIIHTRAVASSPPVTRQRRSAGLSDPSKRLVAVIPTAIQCTAPW